MFTYLLPVPNKSYGFCECWAPCLLTHSLTHLLTYLLTYVVNSHWRNAAAWGDSGSVELRLATRENPWCNELTQDWINSHPLYPKLKTLNPWKTRLSLTDMILNWKLWFCARPSLKSHWLDPKLKTLNLCKTHLSLTDLILNENFDSVQDRHLNLTDLILTENFESVQDSLESHRHDPNWKLWIRARLTWVSPTWS